MESPAIRAEGRILTHDREAESALASTSIDQRQATMKRMHVSESIVVGKQSRCVKKLFSLLCDFSPHAASSESEFEVNQNRRTHWMQKSGTAAYSQCAHADYEETM